MQYTVCTAAHLTEATIRTILQQWNIAAWLALTADEFKEQFRHSEFHWLSDHDRIISLARVNFNFGIQIGDSILSVAELVGLVAVDKSKGYGSLLLKQLQENLAERDIEALGFCEKELRPFYEHCNVNILYGHAQYLRERHEGSWIVSTDDDILDLTLSLSIHEQIRALSLEHPGKIVFI